MSEQAQATPDASEESEAPGVTFKGERFGLNEDLSEWALLEFAEAVDAGADGNDLQGMASLLRFVIELIAPDDRARFRATARRHRATADDLFALLRGEVEEEADRPTGPSADSSDGRESTEPKSASSSAGKGLLPTGRPDLQVAIERAQARAA